MNDEHDLAQTLVRHKIELPPDMIEAIDHYCRLLWQWNEQLNLTRHTDYDRFVSRDVVDCLELAQLLAEGEQVLDVGSGGGVPGVVLGIIRPDVHISLAESVGKRASVLADIVSNMGLGITIFESRAEHLLNDLEFDTLVARAVGPLWKMLKWFEPHWGSFNRLLTVKGPKWTDERGEARHLGYLRKLELRRIASYPLAGTDSESVILEIWPKSRSKQD